MIVCKRCGNHNPVGDSFCASCGAFLEWEGEQVVGDTADTVVGPTVLPPPQLGLVTRIKNAVIGEGSSSDQPSQAGPPGQAPPVQYGMQPPPPGVGSRPPQPFQGGGGFLPPPKSAQGAATPRSPATGFGQSPQHASNPALSSLVAKPVAQAETSARTPQVSSPNLRPPQQAGEPTTIGDRQPGAQMPSTAAVRPKPQSMQPPSREINPGDLVCGSCGEGNAPERKFCRRCGTSLAEIVPVKLSWRRRRANAKAAKAPGFEAGDRPMRVGGKGGGVAKGARQAKGGLLGNLAKVGKVLAILAVLGIGGGMLIPSVRGTMTSKASEAINFVKRKIHPQFVQISPDKTLVTASSAAPGHDAAFVADGVKNDSWIAAPDSQTATVTVVFKQESLSKVLITPGDQSAPASFKGQPRPKDLFVSAVDSTGKIVGSRQMTLADSQAPQAFSFGAKNVVSISFTVQSCYPDPALKVCAISEIEFFKQK